MKAYLLVFTLITFFVSAFFSCKKNETTPSSPINLGSNDTTKSEPLTTQSLGKLLFYDPILSGNKNVACATCHHPDFAYTDGRELSIGVNGIGLGPRRDFISSDFPFTKRNSNTIVNTAFNGMDEKGNFDADKAPMFWDSRVQSLEAQA